MPPLTSTRSRLRPLVAVWVVAVCGCGLPRDPQHTLQRIQETHAVRIGVSAHPPWVTDAAWPPAGIEVEMMQQFADSLDAEITWRFGSEELLLKELEHYQLDVVIGGLGEDTPWSDRVALSRPYDGDIASPFASPVPHVIAAPPGENGWLLHLDRWLVEHRRDIARLVENAAP